jgi:hypothetical protein
MRSVETRLLSCAFNAVFKASLIVSRISQIFLMISRRIASPCSRRNCASMLQVVVLVQETNSVAGS